MHSRDVFPIPPLALQVWCKLWGSSYDDYTFAIPDSSFTYGYLWGTFEGTSIRFGTNILSGTNSRNKPFLVKIDLTNGADVWAFMPAGDARGDSETYGHALSGANTVVVAGRGQYNMTFGSTILYPVPPNNLGFTYYTYVASIDVSTNPPTNSWAVEVYPADSSSDTLQAVQTDSSGNVYLIHHGANGNATFKSANGTDTLIMKRGGTRNAVYLAKVRWKARTHTVAAMGSFDNKNRGLIGMCIILTSQSNSGTLAATLCGPLATLAVISRMSTVAIS